MQCEIDKQRGPAFAPHNLLEAHDPALSRNEFVTGLLAQLFKNRIEERILELLRNDCAAQIEKTAGQTQPFEITVVVARNDDAALGAVSLRLVEIFKLDVFRKICRGQARTP